MKFATVLLLVAGSLVLNCVENTRSLELKLLEKLRISNDEPEEIPVEEFNNEIDAMIEDVPYQVEAIDHPDQIFEENQIQPKTGCSILIKNLSGTQPLYLVPGTTSIWPFSATGTMELTVGQTLELYCPTTYSNPSGKSGSQTATCVSGTTFTIGTTNYNLTQVLCTSWPTSVAQKTGATCNGGVIVQTGFQVGTRFIKQLEICFNEVLEVTRYVSYTLQPGSDYYQSNVVRPSFRSAGFFVGQSVDDLYTQDTVAETFTNVLGSVASTYDLYLARGHLAAMVDFVYATLQRGTFLFVNVAPQWQVVNNGNWGQIEDGTRTWVSQNNLYVNCYTGVYGVTTLANDTGVQTPLYLYYDTNNNGMIPVPMLYFRIVLEPSTQRGIVLIAVNNPLLTLAQIQQDYILCTDVSNQITWLSWNRTNIAKGYSYACSVPDFAQINPNLPALNVTSLLV